MNRVERFKKWCQSNRWIATTIIIGIVIISAGKLLGAFGEIHKFFAHSQLELQSTDGNRLADHEIVAKLEFPTGRPKGGLLITILLKNKGNLSTGKMTVKLYANDPLQLETM